MHAQQMLCGIRAAGALVTAPLPGELPPVLSYPQPLVGASSASTPHPWLAPPAWPSGTPDGSQPPSPYTTLQRPNQQSRGGRKQRERPVLYDAVALALQGRRTSSASRTRSGCSARFREPLPPNLTCFECGAFRQHYGAECPARFVRVRGEAPPGWKMDQLGAVVKDPAAWNGPDLTDAARAQFRAFLDKFSLMAHGTFPVSRDQIFGPAPVPPRRPLPRPLAACALAPSVRRSRGGGIAEAERRTQGAPG